MHYMARSPLPTRQVARCISAQVGRFSWLGTQSLCPEQPPGPWILAWLLGARGGCRQGALAASTNVGGLVVSTGLCTAWLLAAARREQIRGARLGGSKC